MLNKRRHSIIRLVAASTSVLALTTGVSFAADSAHVIRVGTMSGPDADIWHVVTQQAAKQGLQVKVIEFSDYVQPNAALDAGDLDANSFQHRPYLATQIAQRGYKIVSVGLTYTAPFGFYSKKIKSLDALPTGASVGVPNDPSNENRALLLLQAQHVIALNKGVGLNGRNATPLDVASNPKHIKLVELDAAQLARSLDDLSAAAINTDYAVKAGLSPAKDAIAREDARGPYANIIAVRTRDQNKPWVKTLVQSYQSPAVREYIDAHFKGAVIPAF